MLLVKFHKLPKPIVPRRPRSRDYPRESDGIELFHPFGGDGFGGQGYAGADGFGRYFYVDTLADE